MSKLPENCPICGNAIPLDANFCHKCGAKLLTLIERSHSSYLSSICEKLKQDGFHFTSDKIGELDVIVATKIQFKWSWLATQMNIFAIMASIDRISKELIERFSKISLDYAIKYNEGLPRGFQSGVSSFALLVSSKIDEDAKQWFNKNRRNIGRHLRYLLSLILTIRRYITARRLLFGEGCITNSSEILSRDILLNKTNQEGNIYMKCPKCGEEMEEGTVFESGSYGHGIAWINLPLKNYRQKTFWEKMHIRPENVRSKLAGVVELEGFRCSKCKIVVFCYGEEERGSSD